MVNRSKKIGTEHETRTARWFKTHGWPFARRITQKGNRDEGDLTLGDGIPIMIEAKNEKEVAMAEYIKEMEAQIVNAVAENGVVVIKRRGTQDVGEYYALSTVRHWNNLARRAYKTPKRRIVKRSAQ